MSIPLRTLRDGVMDRVDGIVSERIGDRNERRRLAGLMAVLIAAGFAAALGLPMAGFGIGQPAASMLAALTSGGCLALAALAASGSFDAAIAAAAAAGTLLAALLAVRNGGAASPLLWLLPVAPTEALLSGRRHLFWTCLRVAGLALRLVLAATALGVSSGSPAPSAVFAAATAFAAYLLLRRVFTARRRPAKDAVAPAVSTADHDVSGDAGWVNRVRFAPDGEVIEASSEARRRFGERLDSDRLPFALSLVHVADRVQYLSAFGEVRSGASVAECQARLWDAVARRFEDVAFRLAAVRTAARLEEIVFVCDEAAEAAPAQEDLETALAAARAASEAKSSFLAMVSHELRTPLNAIIGFSDVLHGEMFGTFPDPRQKEYVGLIRQSGEHLLAVVNGLLDVSKIEAGRYELTTEGFDIADVVGPAVATVRGEAERKGLLLTVSNECRTGRMVADRRAVHQVIVNLLANAVKFTDAGRVDVTVREADGFMRITVTDTGVGIAPAELPRLGQPFTQGSAGLTRRYPGTGLGLSLVKGFAELHRGAMRITSEPGCGTVVDVTLSLDCQATVEQNEPSTRIVALKHARSPESNVPSSETRRSA